MIFRREPIDYLLNDVYDEVTTRNIHSFELLLDTVDYVPPRFLKKFQKDIFKLYKKQRRQAKPEANRQRNLPPEKIVQPPQDSAPKPTVITSDKLQITDTDPIQALQSPVIKTNSWELDFTGNKKESVKSVR